MSESHLPTALVAGAGGFVGSHLCDALIFQNCRVYGLDNWSTGKKDNLKHLLKNKNFVFLEHDLNLPLKISLPAIDYVFHLAGLEAYLNGVDVSLETLLVNSLGTKRLLEISRKHKAKFLLGSTTDIYSGFLSADTLNNYFSQEKRREESYSHHEAKRFSEALVYEYFNRYQLDARVVRLGYVYGPRMSLDAGDDMARLFKAAIKKEPLVVSAQGLRTLYPTYVADLVYGLTKAMFSQSSGGQIYTLVNPEKTTVLSLANLLKKAFGDEKLNIEFDSQASELGPMALSSTILKSQEDLGWVPKTNLETGITKTVTWIKQVQPGLSDQEPLPIETENNPEDYSLAELGINPAQPVEGETSKPKKRPEIKLLAPKIKPLKLTRPKLSLPNIKFKIKKPSLRLKVGTRAKWIALGFFGLIMWGFGPILLSGAMAYSGVMSLKKAQTITDFTQAEKLVTLTDRAAARFWASRRLLSQSSLTIRLIGLKELSDNYDRLLSIGINLSQGGKHLAQAGESGTLLTQVVLHHEDGNIAEAIKRIQLNLDQAYSELSFVESELQSGRQINQDLTSNLAQAYQTLTDELPKLRQKINQLRSVLPLIPGFIAQDTKKTYLVLFQNSTELRPTGGFIGSYGLLTFEKGQLLDFSVEDIYAADGQLKGFVEPPKPIKDAFGENTWFFRDSNWDPDFTVSAERAEWFLQKTTNRNVDGVIAVNLPAVKFLLVFPGSHQR